MSNLEKARNRLKAAFARLESVVEIKISSLEAATFNLSGEITTLKEKLQMVVNQPQLNELSATKKKLSSQSDTMLVNKQASQQIDLSLNELKKLVK